MPQKHLRPGKNLASDQGMRHRKILSILLLLLGPAALAAAGQKVDINVNSRYRVESVEVTGIPESEVGKALLEDMQKLVGQNYDPDAADRLADRLRRRLPEHSVSVRVRRGDQPGQVKVDFVAERLRWKRFEVRVPPVVYHSKLGWSGALDIPLRVRHSVFTFGMVNSADELLERNAGFRLRYENRRLGTDLVQLRIDFDSYHAKWNPATETALAQAFGVPGVYRTRQNFAPSLSLIPLRDLKLSVGTAFERMQTQYPSLHTDTAYAGTAELQYRRDLESRSRIRQRIEARYGVRSAARVLDSDFVYTRHLWTAGYSLSRHRSLFGICIQGGLITGNAPLFERFSLGNGFTLRGWNKFDVAPLGGRRMAHGTVEYRYRPFHLFYDAGAVWDTGQAGRVRHGLGFGWLSKDGFFASLAFPIRLHRVYPVFMAGFRY